MPETLKILAQSAPSATTETALYTVAASTQVVVSGLVVCNRGSTATTFRVYIAINGAATANAQYLYYDTHIAPNDSVCVCQGLTLDTSDVIRVYAGNANLSFNLFGSEIT